jgi:hypothetical protein
MRMLFGWSVFVGLVWFLIFATLQVVAITYPDQADKLAVVRTTVEQIGWGSQRSLGRCCN